MKALSLLLIMFLLHSCSKQDLPLQISKKIKKPTEEIDSKTHSIDFKILSNFELPIPDPAMADQKDLKFISEALPEKVSTLNNQRIKIKGFMIPLKFDKDEKIISFSFTADQGACCQGKIPALNEVIYCTSDKPSPDLRDTLLEITGTFKATPQINKADQNIYLYSMKVHSIKELKLMPPTKGPDISF